MVEIIRFRDAESFAISFFKIHLPPRGFATKVGTKLPSGHTTDDLFVRVSRTGGTSRDLVTDSPTLLVECFAGSTVTASEMASTARALMLAAARLTDEVTKATDGGGVSELPDPDTNQPRYQFLVQLDLRGAAI